MKNKKTVAKNKKTVARILSAIAEIKIVQHDLTKQGKHEDAELAMSLAQNAEKFRGILEAQ